MLINETIKEILFNFSEHATIQDFTGFLVEKSLLPSVTFLSIGKMPDARSNEIVTQSIALDFIQLAYEGEDVPLAYMYEYLQTKGYME